MKEKQFDNFESLFLGFLKEDLFYFFQIKFSRFFIFLYFYNPVVLFLADMNCKKNIAMKVTYKIVALFTENYPSISHRQFSLFINAIPSIFAILCVGFLLIE